MLYIQAWIARKRLLPTKPDEARDAGRGAVPCLAGAGGPLMWALLGGPPGVASRTDMWFGAGFKSGQPQIPLCK